MTQNYRNPNWWWNDIGVPTTLAETCLLLAPEFQSPEQLAQADRNLDSKRWNQLTGQNLVWMTKIRILRGCLLNNEEVVRSGFERLWQEIFIAPIGQEGVQADGAFTSMATFSTPEATARGSPRTWRTWPLAQRAPPLPSPKLAGTS